MTHNLTRSHAEATIERFQKDPDLAAELLAAILIDGDKDELLQTMKLVEKAFPEIAPLKKS